MSAVAHPQHHQINSRCAVELRISPESRTWATGRELSDGLQLTKNKPPFLVPNTPWRSRVRGGGLCPWQTLLRLSQTTSHQAPKARSDYVLKSCSPKLLAFQPSFAMRRAVRRSLPNMDSEMLRALKTYYQRLLCYFGTNSIVSVISSFPCSKSTPRSASTQKNQMPSPSPRSFSMSWTSRRSCATMHRRACPPVALIPLLTQLSEAYTFGVTPSGSNLRRTWNARLLQQAHAVSFNGPSHRRSVTGHLFTLSRGTCRRVAQMFESILLRSTTHLRPAKS